MAHIALFPNIRKGALLISKISCNLFNSFAPAKQPLNPLYQMQNKANLYKKRLIIFILIIQSF